MIRSIKGKTTQDIYHSINSRQARRCPLNYAKLRGKSRRLLDQIDAAPNLDFPRVPPGNRLEKLRGDLSGYWSLRINDQWRVIFRWENQDALDIEITGYH